jgi:hypothetical protein
MIGGSGRALVLDPGVTTGWMVVDYPEDDILQEVAHGMQGGGVRGMKDLWPRLVDEFGFTRVVSESFILDGRTATPDLTPVEMEGALTILWDGHLILQRNTYKAFCPNHMLEKLGWDWPGPGHDRDAGRHAFAAGVTLDHRPTAEFYTEHG